MCQTQKDYEGRREEERGEGGGVSADRGGYTVIFLCKTCDY